MIHGNRRLVERAPATMQLFVLRSSRFLTFCSRSPCRRAA
jgi:hypothetical protein